MSSNPADFFILHVLDHFHQTFYRPNESFKFILLLLVCICVEFLSNMNLFTISTKPLINNLLRLETISFPSCKYILIVSVLFDDPLSLFTIFHNTLGVLYELVIMF
jgi:hypothetical protein